MSSHHVVKEKQEPALIIHDLIHDDEHLLNQLLEWTPTVVTNDVCALPLMAAGIKIDVLISNRQVAPAQSHITLITGSQQSSLEDSFNYLLSEGYPAVNILGETAPLDILAFYWKKINIVVFQQGRKIFPIKTGFNKWKPANDLIVIYGQKNTFTTKGLRHVDGSLYTTLNDGFYEVNFSDKAFMLIAELF